MENSVYTENNFKKGKSRIKTQKNINTGNLLFYLSIIVLPCLQFLLLYIVVNINYLAMAFQKYEYDVHNQLINTFVGFENIKNVIVNLGSTPLKYAFKNSLMLYLVNLIFTVFLSILFSYYIYKKNTFSEFFKIIIYLPNIISSMAMSIMFNYFLEDSMPIIWENLFGYKPMGFITNPSTNMFFILFFNVLMGFGPNVLIYSGTMSNIPYSTIESAQIDGANGFVELFKIVIPQIFSTITTFLVAGIAALGTNQMYLFNFYSLGADNTQITYGYYLYVTAQKNLDNLVVYPELAALGIVLTFIIAPLTLVIKKLLETFGPSND